MPIPRRPDTFIGRAVELAELRALLTNQSTRLVTLVGPGGVGKTRLACRIVDEIASEFAAKPIEVDLSTTTDASAIPFELAHAIGIELPVGDPSLELLADAVGSRRRLIVLDNLEQIADGHEFVEHFLNAAPSSVVLVTSRKRLSTPHEQVVEIGTLELPAEGTELAVEDLGSLDSVALFLSRAAQHDPTFALRPDNAGDVAEVIRRLDGLPLALELASARLKILTPAALRRRLDQPLTLLTRRDELLPPRQLTMREAILWSVDLLTPAEQDLFCRLACFQGGFSLEAAEHVVGPTEESAQAAEPTDRRPPTDPATLDLLTSLVDAHLVRRIEAPGSPEARFTMLQTIKDVALELLATRNMESETRARHADFFQRTAQSAKPHLRGPTPEIWFDRLQADHENTRAAIEWLLETSDIQSALSICTSIWWFWRERGYRRDAAEWLTRSLDAVAAHPDVPTLDVANGWLLLGHTVQNEKKGWEYYSRSLEHYRKTGSEPHIAGALTSLGIVAAEMGEFDRARQFQTKSRTIFRRLGMQDQAAHAEFELGCIAVRQGLGLPASRHFERALTDYEEVENAHGVALCWYNLGRLHRIDGKLEDARTFLSWSLSRSQRVGSDESTALTLIELGLVALDEKSLAEACRHFQEALRLTPRIGFEREQLALALEGVGLLAMILRDEDLGVRLFAAAERWRDHHHLPLPPSEAGTRSAKLAEARRILGRGRFETVWDIGLRCPIDLAVELALGVSITSPSPKSVSQRSTQVLPQLTPRQRAVLCLIADGLSDRAISSALGITIRTATTHVQSILNRLGVNNRAAAAAVAVRSGLCPGSSAEAQYPSPNG